MLQTMHITFSMLLIRLSFLSDMNKLIPLAISELLLLLIMVMFSSACLTFIYGLDTTLEVKAIWFAVFVAIIAQGYAIRYIVEKVYERRNVQSKKSAVESSS